MTIGTDIAAGSAEWAKKLINKSLKLPKSTFPPRPKPALWQEYTAKCIERDYLWQQQNRPADNPFILQDGPPYANGPLHLGHALNKILKDMILRFKVQQGRRVVYVPGWDCHGLPIELKALANASSSSSTTRPPPLATRYAARKLAHNEVLRQMAEFQSFAVMGDWCNRWTTMDAAYELKQLRLFQRMVGQGLVHRQYKPVYWSPSSGTALAEAELEYRDDHISNAAFVQLPIVAGPELAALGQLDGIDQLFAVIWTTTPWTLPANRAIAVHDDMDYSIVKAGSHGLLVANSRLSHVLPTCLHDHDPEMAAYSLKGKQLKNLRYTNPLLGKNAPPQPIIHADFVSEDSGTGLVHCAPGHGLEDYEVCKRLGIPISAPVDDDGKFTAEAYPEDPGRLEGLRVLNDGSSAVLQILDGYVLATEKYKHKYPYDWRTKQPVIVRATAQWFADVASIRDDALRALDRVKFIPGTAESRLRSFVNERNEWCISRQRAWGVPIPALFDENGEALMTAESIGHIISVLEERGTDRWWSDPPEDLAWIPPSLHGKGDCRRGTDTMDVWLDSGSAWAMTGQQADVYLEGTDQHRGWFQSTLLTWVAAAQANKTTQARSSGGTASTAPFRTLITHGFTLDGQGKKMSKSLGNIISPADIMTGTYAVGPIEGPPKGVRRKADSNPALGPDALRLWVASSDFQKDLSLNEHALTGVTATLVKFRTTIKMLLGCLRLSARTSPLTALDHIAMIQLQDTMEEVGRCYDDYRFFRGVGVINRWVNIHLSAFYITACKDRLYCGDGGGVAEPLFWGFMRMLAPITPVLVEEAWTHLPQWLKEDTSTTHPFQQLYDDPLVDAGRFATSEAKVRADMPALLAAQQAVNRAFEAARSRRGLKTTLDCDAWLSAPRQPDAAALFDSYADELADIFNVSAVHLGESAGEGQVWAEENESFAVGDVDYTITLGPAGGHKCPRCWRHVAAREDQLCGRCEDVFASYVAGLSPEEVESHKEESGRAATAA